MSAMRSSSRLAAALIAAAALTFAPVGPGLAADSPMPEQVHKKGGQHGPKGPKAGAHGHGHGHDAQGQKIKHAKHADEETTELAEKVQAEHHDNGLHLGTFANGKLTDEQAERVAAAIQGVSSEDLRTMTVGEIIKAARASGLTVHDLGALLDEPIEDDED